MITASEIITSALNSPVRKTQAKVELYEGSTLVNTFYYNDRLINFDIERVGEESKFFGFGICQRLNVHLIDKNRELDIPTTISIKVYLGNEDTYISPYPLFNVNEVHRDENTNELSITAYDNLYGASTHKVGELEITSYTVEEFAAAAGAIIEASGVEIVNLGEAETCFATSYESGANFGGTETIREALDDVAEATQTIYYLNSDEKLVFKRLDKDKAADLSITKSDYITLSSRTSRRLAKIFHVTELGDNVSASTTETGSTQYVRDNAFWSLRDDIGTLVDNALAAVGGLTINQFDLGDWRGNYLLEIGDKISLTTKDNGTVNSFVLNDTVSYNGGLSEKTSWSYTDNEEETADNPTSLGDVLKQTTAKVDKASQTIELMASSVEDNTEAVSSLLLNTESITASVQEMKDENEAARASMEDEIAELSSKVNATITAEDVKVEIQKELLDGVDKVTTSTGFTFNDEGLSVSKTDSEMKTTITEDGMTVYKNEEAVLTANNVGVNAVNLHATTYLIIGTNSRFEDYNGNRTGCFFIGS
ncbi:MAG: hypothetical protein ACI3T9_01375 [Romboutsia timonensis]